MKLKICVIGVASYTYWDPRWTMSFQPYPVNTYTSNG